MFNLNTQGMNMTDYVLRDDGKELFPGLIPNPPPDELPLADLRIAPHFFQFRRADLIEYHVADLVSALKRGDPLDRIAVWYSTAGPVVIDGHHRLEAYRRANWCEPVPITLVAGGFAEARMYAASENSKAKLALTSAERSDAAWVLVAGDYSLSQRRVAAVANVSLGTVNRMVEVARRLREQGTDPASIGQWAKARRSVDGQGVQEFDEERLEAWARDWCDRLTRAFGTKAQSQPDVLAKALEMYYGERIGSLVVALPRADEFWDEDSDF